MEKSNMLTGKAREIRIQDAEYPKNLKNIKNPPQRLYVKGEMLACDDIAVAIVGTRRATIYGLETAERLAYELASRGVTIVSGLARGIDSAAHRGALKAYGRTIAVFGCGIDYIYPRENKGLASEIEKSGALISEFEMGAEPLPQHFPQRNRIISGLSLGVVVVEAARESGALITAGLALEQGREVFAVPGKINSATSAGVHGLLKDGAKLVECTEDIIDELNLELKAAPVEAQNRPGPKLEKAESKVYSILSDEPKYIDDISADAGLPLNEVSNIVLKLQLKKLIKELPGKLYYKET